jgi:thiol-disulfide isomerase/thioredoxin
MVTITTNGFAQNTGNNPPKATEKQDESQIDYKQIGAPMPPIRFIVYEDTATAKKDSVKKEPVVQKKKKKKQVAAVNEGQKKVITNADVNNGANLLIMLFNPTCSHCEEETILLQRNSTLFKKSKFLMMVNPVMAPYLHDFTTRLHINDYPFFKVGVDSGGYVNNVFLYQALPQINIYNAERKLIRVYSGEVPIDSLKQYIE